MLENVFVGELCHGQIGPQPILVSVSTPTFLMNGIHPKSVLGGAGVRSRGSNAPRYVRGAYCLGKRDRNTTKSAKYTTAIMSVGTSVDIRPDREGEVFSADPMFSSLL